MYSAENQLKFTYRIIAENSRSHQKKALDYANKIKDLR